MCLLCYILKVFAQIKLSQVIDLTSVSQELAYLASDADLVIMEGMVSIFFPPISEATNVLFTDNDVNQN